MPTPRRRARIAAVLAIVAPAPLLGLVGGIGVLACLPYAAVGGLLAIRRPGNPVGWLLVALAWCFAMFALPAQATTAQLLAGTVRGPAMAATVVQAASGGVLLALLLAICIVYPSGRLPEGRAGVAARLAITVMVVFAIQAVVAPTINASASDTEAGVSIANPLAELPDLAIWKLAPAALYVAVIPLLLAGVVSIFVRLRRARGVEAAQLRWLAWSVAAIFAGIIIGIVGDTLFPTGLNGLVWVPAEIAFPLPAVAIGLAILRYHLYDIDRIVSRTIAWAVLTGVLAAAFVTVVIVAQAALAPLTRSNDLAVAGSTLLVAASFGPVRRRIQTIVDRRFDRARYDAARTAQAFAGRLRDEVDLTRIADDLTETARHALSPIAIGLWVHRSDSR
ncbi:MAG TPA: hypothetical protein VEY67_02840 [Candidatus Dormibacteraeota bacterium]|nr:hypothetical protein [Candidatus Dormibacteraeota bacterium]